MSNVSQLTRAKMSRVQINIELDAMLKQYTLGDFACGDYDDKLMELAMITSKIIGLEAFTVGRAQDPDMSFKVIHGSRYMGVLLMAGIMHVFIDWRGRKIAPLYPHTVGSAHDSIITSKHLTLIRIL